MLWTQRRSGITEVGRGVRIASPMCDAVFKHLLEDAESAHLIVGTILGEQIDEIELA